MCTNTHMGTDTGICMTMSMINCTYRGMPLTEAINDYDSDMNQNEYFQLSFATWPKCMFIGCYHEIYYRTQTIGLANNRFKNARVKKGVS